MKALNGSSSPRVHRISVAYGKLKKYQLVQWIHQQFWERWSQEYLKTLQHRVKWTTVQPNIEKDDMVILKDEKKHHL